MIKNKKTGILSLKDDVMFEIGDYVVYRTTVCQVTQIKEEYLNALTYYQLAPLDKTTLIYHVSAHSSSAYLRSIISKEEAVHLIEEMNQTELITGSPKDLETSYKRCMSQGTLKDLIQVYMTSSSRMEERRQAGKKISERDRSYYERSRKCLVDEFSVALKMDAEKTSCYIQKQINVS